MFSIIRSTPKVIKCRYPYTVAASFTLSHGRGQPERKDGSLMARRNATMSMTQLSEMAKDGIKGIQMRDIADAPPPIFWISSLGLIPTLLPTVTNILFGFSPTFSTIQMTFAATVNSFLGGAKYGTHVKEEKATWEEIVASVGPQTLSFIGLLLPQQLGFIFITVAIAATTFVDLVLHKFPPWYRSMRLAFAIPTILFLALTAFTRLFK